MTPGPTGPAGAAPGVGGAAGGGVAGGPRGTGGLGAPGPGAAPTGPAAAPPEIPPPPSATRGRNASGRWGGGRCGGCRWWGRRRNGWGGSGGWTERRLRHYRLRPGQPSPPQRWQRRDSSVGRLSQQDSPLSATRHWRTSGSMGPTTELEVKPPPGELVLMPEDGAPPPGPLMPGAGAVLVAFRNRQVAPAPSRSASNPVAAMAGWSDLAEIRWLHRCQLRVRRRLAPVGQLVEPGCRAAVGEASIVGGWRMPAAAGAL